MLKKSVSLIVGMGLLTVASIACAETRLAVQDTGGADKMAVTDKGRIGIGVGTTNTALPDAAIHVKGAAYPDQAIKVEGTVGGGYIALITMQPNVWPTTGTKLGFEYFGAINSSANPTVSYHATGLYGAVESTWATGSTPSYFAFETTPAGSTSRVERFRISSAGYVGIGTMSTPTQKLEIKDGGIRLNNAVAQPTCDNTAAPNVRGLIWFVKGTTGADTLQICSRVDGSNYAWRVITLTAP